MDDINSKLDKLFIRYEKAMNNDGYYQFQKDGLLHRGGRETEIWNNAKFRLCFLLKDSYSSYDARDYFNVNGRFGFRLAMWIYGINKFDGNYVSIDEAYKKENKEYAFQNEAVAIINIKKEKGVSTANNSQIKEHAKKYASFLKEQFDILKPNIVISGGNITFHSAKQFIFESEEYIEIKTGILLYPSMKMVLFNNFHPSALLSNSRMYKELLDKFAFFMKNEYAMSIL